MRSIPFGIRFVLLMAGLWAAVGVCQASEPYPAKPITLIVPYPPGAAVDTAGRLIAQDLGKRLGQQVVIENVGGASGTIGAKKALRAPADGYTLMLGNVSDMVLAPMIVKDAKYEGSDFAPIAKMLGGTAVLVAKPSFPANTTDELIAYAKANPEKVSMGSTGSATFQTLAALIFQQKAGIKFVEVPYKGGAPMTVDLMGGQLDLGAIALPSVLQYIRQGKLKSLGVLSAQRDINAPDLPTVNESRHVKDVGAIMWAGIVGPPKLPAEVVEKLNRTINEMMRSADFRQAHAQLGSITFEPSTPADFHKFISEEQVRYRQLIDGREK
ncbi:tripartite tricarboxylate transporter substrate binding protein [Variovorax sp. NFACC27]|uniref:Tripartite-type tricarboxylate transporter receptor subunit TctC n=1 Tax=Variovorax beijingensis TaxID=2496117 RepID=A0A561BAS0_9BURK|nr:tripartite tricarboxylate transporter substrate binding protein [Variovorax beijingensis]SEF22130.1 Tripartite-type tricarboxylate transporter, receptor component TctC [Variovorax sp. NFACC28]SEG09374.1 Tripartite-type tricarboxylate transporter, receptor component TctC [Variovorax sp. NFACC29]SFC03778.1 Tripartite-type tricarboxylate transporter, receptor component TctC [Variovorax sp. NFACC26]SFF77577.1 Tripartite-type tricarboxylate transporter, receptor component TctC [Variovorax sp. NFA